MAEATKRKITTPRKSRSTTKERPSIYEIWVGYAAGIACLGTIIYLLILNEPIKNEFAGQMITVLLSLLAGIFGATIPGLLNLDMRWRTTTIRSGGALALFVIVFFFSPQTLPALRSPSLILIQPKVIDFRTDEPWGEGDEYLEKPAAITVPTWYVNKAQSQLANTAQITASSLQFQIGDVAYILPWHSFVNHQPDGEWHNNQVTAAPQSLVHGEIKDLETLFRNNELTWGKLLDAFRLSTEDQITYHVSSETSEGQLNANCTVDMVALRVQIQEHEQANQESPFILTPSCLEG